MKTITATLLLVAAAALPCGAADAPAPGVVSHVKVTSDKVKDVSSLDAWKRSHLHDAMGQRDKALAVWESVVAFRHQAPPPNEFLQGEVHPHDPIKSFNVYGYNQCCCASASIQALARYAGLQSRGWAITAHSVPEVGVDGHWCMLDASLVNYFAKPDGQLAGVEELTRDINDWYAQNPGLKGDDAKLRQFMAAGGWRRGPGILANSNWYDDNGWLPAATHGWYATMQEYSGDPFVYEYGTALGYEVNVQLRRGERLTRNWSNKGLHVNMLEGGDCPTLNAVPGKDDLRYSPKFGDLAPGRIGNGTLEFTVPWRHEDLVRSALAVENLEDEDGEIRINEPGREGVLVVRMPSSYVYLTGQLSFTTRLGEGSTIGVQLSDNNGLDWKDVATVAASGEQRIDLKPWVYRKYDYRVKLTWRSKGQAAAVKGIQFVHDVQHSQRPLPALDKGDNRITFAVGPQEGTVVIEGSSNPEHQGKNLLVTDFHPQAKGMSNLPRMHLDGGEGEITFPVQTPGDLTRLRVGAHYRARDERDGFDVLASFDAGKTWKPLGRLEGPTAGNSKYLVFGDVPAGTRSALVKFAGKQRNTTLIFDLRISADYQEPAGGLAPVKVTYVWEEGGVEKRHEHVATKAEESYTIRCAAKPVMKSLIVERPDGGAPRR